MPDPIWTPSLDDSESDGLSVRLRAAVLTALPDLVTTEQRGRGAGRRRLVDIAEPSGLTVRLEVMHTRSVMRNRRPILEVRFRGIARSPERENGRSVELPIGGECRLDIDSGAIVHLEL